MANLWDNLKRWLGLDRNPKTQPPAVDWLPITSASAQPASVDSAPAPRAAVPKSSKSSKADYEASEILGLSAEEMRRRALHITPWRTPWIGRTDVIPPASDERTALIDRGIVLRGLLRPAQLEEIHRVGDLWLEHRDRASLARMEGERVGDEAAAQVEKERAERKAAKRKASAERAERRATEIARRRREDIIYLGVDVSSRLHDRRANIEKLSADGLPVLATPADLATALEIPVPRLRWLAYHAEVTARTHYVCFEVPKRSGGVRHLAAPHRDLARVQGWILEHILSRLAPESPAHGFVSGRSTVTNAQPHLGAGMVVNLDLKDFFPSITWPRVRGLFESLGYSPAVATILTLLVTEAPRRAVELDGQRLWVATGPRGLPQGACTSPALSNLIVRKLDRRLRGMASKHGWTYTRYADDLTFSRSAGGREGVAMLLARVRHIVSDEGFTLHPEKGRVQGRGGRQSVTGLVVNNKLGVPREEVRRLRAILHQAKHSSLAAQNRGARPDFAAWLRGKIAYLSMVDQDKGARLLGEFEQLLARDQNSAVKTV
jgi:retron-type reverse transcriptase